MLQWFGKVAQLANIHFPVEGVLRDGVKSLMQLVELIRSIVDSRRLRTCSRPDGGSPVLRADVLIEQREALPAAVKQAHERIIGERQNDELEPL